mgnify:FL=1
MNIVIIVPLTLILNNLADDENRIDKFWLFLSSYAMGLICD